MLWCRLLCACVVQKTSPKGVAKRPGAAGAAASAQQPPPRIGARASVEQVVRLNEHVDVAKAELKASIRARAHSVLRCRATSPSVRLGTRWWISPSRSP